jgi:hypothetical protein
MFAWRLSGYLIGKGAWMTLSKGFLNQGSKQVLGPMTRVDKIDSLANTFRLYPKYAAAAILGMGMDWDGKALYNKHANELEERLVDCENMVEKLVERIKK